MASSRATTSSGHSAGINSAAEFGERERALKRQRDNELAGLSRDHEETVYRDKQGRKLDMLTEFMRQQSTKDGQKAMIDKAQYEWGRGSVQKKEQVERLQELADIANEPFARTIGKKYFRSMFVI